MNAKVCTLNEATQAYVLHRTQLLHIDVKAVGHKVTKFFVISLICDTSFCDYKEIHQRNTKYEAYCVISYVVYIIYYYIILY